MPAAADHRLDPSFVERLEPEAADLCGAKAGGRDEVELGLCIEQPERGHVGRKGRNEAVGNLLEGGREVGAGNGGDRLPEGQLPAFTLLEEMPGADLIGEIDREHDQNAAPAVGVDQVEGCAPPAQL